MKKFIFFLILLCIAMSVVAGKISNSLIELDIPDELEIQSGTGETLSSTLSAGEDWGVVLQNKGKNSQKDIPANQYCRVVVMIQNAGWDDYSNGDFEKEVSSYTKQMLADIYDYLEATLAGDSTVLERYKRETTKIGGKFALHVSIAKNSSVAGRGSITSDAYYFYVNGYLYFITCSYTDSCSKTASKVISSVKIMLEDLQKSDGTLYERNLPWVSSKKFLWPDKDTEWTTSYSGTDATTKKLSFSDIWGLGFMCEVSVMNSSASLNKQEQKETLSTFKNQIVSNVKDKLEEYGISITKNIVSNGVGKVEYTYTYSNKKYYGYNYSYFVDNKRFVSVYGESVGSPNSVLNKIINSFGY